MGNKVLKNGKWIVISKLVQSILGLVISMMTARYLGVSDYGLMNYVISITSFFFPIASLGINAILVKELIQEPNKSGEILGTSLFLELLSSFACLIGSAGFVFFANPGEIKVVQLSILYSIILPFKAFEVFQYWFQAQYLSKYSAIAAVISYTSVSLYRVFLLINSKSIYWFSLSNALDFFILSLLLLIFYRKLGGTSLSVSVIRARKLLNLGKYYIFSELMVVIFAQIDRIMLKNIVGNEALGYFTAAMTGSILTQFFFVSLIEAFRPHILSLKKSSKSAYEKSITNLYSIIIYISIIQGICVTTFSEFFISLFYGGDFLNAIPVLKILIWQSTFSYIGAVNHIWLLAEGKQKFLILINSLGALSSILLNFSLIPEFGVQGAAVASVLTQLFTNFVLVFVFRNTREIVKLIISSVNPKIILEKIELQLKTK